MIKTTEYFNMSIDELLTTRGSGYTREECKILDDGLHVTFFDDSKEYDLEKEDYQNWIKRAYPEMELKAELITINQRIAVIYA